MRLLVSLLSAAIALVATAQSVPSEILSDINRAGGVYYAYPVATSLNTAPPKGFKPFYISHYGRHGSRYLISDNDYLTVLRLLEQAHQQQALTSLGEDVYRRVKQVWQEAEGRGGELTPLGFRQHKGIAHRMYDAFPEVFEGDAEVTANSTVVMRCACR